MNAGDIVARLDPVNLGGIEKQHPSLHLEPDPRPRAGLRAIPHLLDQRAQLRRQRRPLPLGDSRLGPLHGLIEALLVNRLQQIIDRANLERVDRVLVECGDEDHRRNRLLTYLRDHVEAVHLRHLDVEKNQIGFVAADCLDRLGAGCTLGDARQIIAARD